MRNITLTWLSVGLILTISLWALLRAPGYNIEKVHPEVSALHQPYRSLKPYFYFDGGSVGVELVDAQGKVMQMALPFGYKRLLLGKTHESLPGGEEVPLTIDSKKFIAEKIEEYGEKGYDRNFALLNMRGALRDKLREWWERDKYYP